MELPTVEKRLLIAAKAEAVGVELAARVAEGGINDVALRHDGQPDQNVAVRMREHVLHAVELFSPRRDAARFMENTLRLAMYFAAGTPPS